MKSTKVKPAAKSKPRSRDHFQRLVASIKDVLYVVDARSREFSYLSPAFERLLGYTPADIKTMGGREAFLAQVIQGGKFGEQQATFERLQARPAKGASSSEAWWRCKDGSLVCLEDGWIPIYEGQRLVSTDGVLRDITERKRAEEALREARDKLEWRVEERTAELTKANQRLEEEVAEHKRAEEALRFTQFAVDNTGDGAFWMGPDARFTYVNDAACRSLGYSREELLSMGVPDIDPLFPQEIWADFWSNLKDSRALTFEACHRTKDGRTFPVEIRANFVEFEGREYDCAFARNITERKQAEEALRQAEQKYRSIFENAVEGVFQSTPQGKFLTVNPALARMLGYASPEELITTVQDIPNQLYADPEQRARYVRLLEEHNVVRAVECQLLRKDGSRIWVSFHARTTRDANGVVVRYEGTVEDITHRKRLVEQLQQAQKMQAFGQLAGGVAHDFNNILTVIQGNAALLQTNQLSVADQAAATADIVRATERAANLTRQLLTFSRRQPLQPKDLDLNEVVINMTKMLQRLIGEHIALEARYAPGGAPVHADPGMMEQVLVNLAVNSRDAMAKGGRLIIQTSAAVLNETTVFTKHTIRRGEFVRLSVTDTGCGIAAEHLPHIFEPFFTTKEVGKGTGLGLATVFGIVEQHEGWIEVESLLNVGTTFHIYLPRSERSASRPEPLPARRARGGTETILLVEDEAAVRQLLQSVLEHHGYRVHEAVSGVKALELWRQHQPAIDLLVTDMVMPEGIGGRELADRLRSEKPGLKVIYCSGYTDDVLGKDSPLRGNVNFLEKPFDPHQFLQRVRDCLDAG